MRINFLSSQYFWILNIISALIALMSIDIKLFCILGILLSMINSIILIFQNYLRRFFILENNVKIGMLGIITFWTPIYIFSLNPDLHSVLMIYYVLSTSVFLGIILQVISRLRLKF